MRDEWEKVTLGDMISVSQGYTFKPEFQGIQGEKWQYFKVADIGLTKNYKYLRTALNSISEEIKQQLNIKEFLAGSIVFPRVGAALLNNNKKILLQDSIVDDNTIVITPKTTSICNEFLYYWFQTQQLKDFCNDGPVPVISGKNIKSTKILLPSISEQQKIAETLSIWDSAIEKTEKLISLEKKRLAAFAVKLFSGKTKFQTKNKYLREMLKEKSELSTGLEEVFSVSVHKGLVNQIEHLGRSFAAKNTDNYNLVKFGHLVYTKSPTGDFPYGIVKQSSIKKDVIVSPLYGIYEPESYEIGLIVEFFFESPIRCTNYLYPLIQKGAKNTISISNQDFLKGKIYFPENKKAINKIAEFIQMSKGYISLLKKQLEQYKLQKQGLMQKLLTGEWRVK